MNPKSEGVGTGHWWRWTHYELRAGYIRPARGAKLRVYDAWERWHATRPIGHGAYQADEPTPYQSLLNMLRKLRYEKGVDVHFTPAQFDMLAGPLTEESEKEILDWCQQYGLLGVLPHRTLQVTLAADDDAQIQYARMSVGWMASKRHSQNPLTPMLAPNVVMRPLQGTGIAAESLLVTWARFFPDVPRDERLTYRYPEPLTEQFWKLYAEPIQDFLSGARALQQALLAIRLLQSRDPRDRKLRSFHQVTGGLLSALEPLVAPMGLCVEVERRGGRRLRLHWVGTSLLSSLAAMLLEDLTGGSALQCPCGQLFVSKAYQARYCSRAHRWRFEKRKQRKAEAK